MCGHRNLPLKFWNYYNQKATRRLECFPLLLFLCAPPAEPEATFFSASLGAVPPHLLVIPLPPPPLLAATIAETRTSVIHPSISFSFFR
ncbi:hypothetical protein CRG98_031342 [Punica granatum]|uniref:Uncharacterized protein n=1 Tax=Punica granatum TaxID=22663 RepID=A0A2I0IW74_PUNGR|nr:hypothetical protein CRG98_031342 [Punica granatum]